MHENVYETAWGKNIKISSIFVDSIGTTFYHQLYMGNGTICLYFELSIHSFIVAMQVINDNWLRFNAYFLFQICEFGVFNYIVYILN